MNAPDNQPEKIAPELLALLHSLAAKQQIAKASYEAVIQEVTLLYKLGTGDTADIATDIITRAEKKSELREVKTGTDGE